MKRGKSRLAPNVVILLNLDWTCSPEMRFQIWTCNTDRLITNFLYGFEYLQFLVRFYCDLYIIFCCYISANSVDSLHKLSDNTNIPAARPSSSRCIIEGSRTVCSCILCTPVDMAGSLQAVVVASLALASTVSGESLLWHDEFDTLDQSVWNHLVTAWRGGNNEFEYYRNNRKNRYRMLQNISSILVSNSSWHLTESTRIW